MKTKQVKGQAKFGLVRFDPVYLSINQRQTYGLRFADRSVMLLGAAGKNYWRYFLRNHHRASRRHRHPLDNWSVVTLQKIAKREGIKKSAIFFPFQQRHQKKSLVAFQAIAKKIGFTPSPLGMSIHPQFGLWVGFRGGFASHMVPKKLRVRDEASPCQACVDKPCMTACPAGAVTRQGFDYAACQDYLSRNKNCECLLDGCLARMACPVGAPIYQYNPNQIRFFWRGLLSQSF